jgi:hypothetical protein
VGSEVVLDELSLFHKSNNEIIIIKKEVGRSWATIFLKSNTSSFLNWRTMLRSK